MTEKKTLKGRVRLRMARTGENYTQARAAILGTPTEKPDPSAATAQAVILKVNPRSARVRLLGEEGKDGEEAQVTFRSADAWELAPGHLAELRIHKRWTHRGHAYASGRVTSMRIDIPALGLVPLPVEDTGLIDFSTYEPFRDPEPYAPMWRKLTAEPRPAIKFHEIAWRGRRSHEEGDPDDSPVGDAHELTQMGDREGAREVLMELLHDDLRCIDAHAHLGNLEFEENVKAALAHYEIGIRIGALSVPTDDPSLVLLWGMVHNRPYLRCMHGYGLCLWRLDRLAEAEAVFERMLTLNPPDNQGARDSLLDVRQGRTWQMLVEEREALRRA